MEEGIISQSNDTNEVIIDLNSDKLEYFQEKNQFVATGKAKIIIEDQNSELEAKKVTYDQKNQIIIAEDNVKIKKNGNIIYGNYARINLKKESALINNPNTTISKVKIRAKTADVYPENMNILKGRAVINNRDLTLKLTTNEFGESRVPGSVDLSDKINEKVPPRYRIEAREIIIDSKKDVNVITMKHAKIYVGKVKIASIPKLVINTDKDLQRVETMLPEIGHTRELGGYAGIGYIFDLPFSAMVKTVPLFAYNSKGDLGLGGMLKLSTPKNRTELAYTTVGEKLVVRGEQKFTPFTRLVYGTNSFVDDGFFGQRIPKYIMELVDNRLLASAMNFDFHLRSSAGYAEDINRDYGTAKFQFQGTLLNREPILSYKNYANLRLISQSNISVYGNGETFGMLRAGPNLNLNLGRLFFNTTYFQATTYGNSPFLYDRYVQGKSSLIVQEEVRITKLLSLGHIANLNLAKDNWENRLATENQFYARVGPDDFKLRIGYDFVRNRSIVGLDLLIGTGATGIDFEKLKINQESKKQENKSKKKKKIVKR